MKTRNEATKDYYKLNIQYQILGDLLKVKSAILFIDDIPNINPAIREVINKMSKIVEEKDE